MPKLIPILLAVTFSSPNVVSAAVGTFDGETESDWTEAHYNIIVATLEAVQSEGSRDAGRFTVTLAPKATIAGAFDCSLHPRLTASCWYAAGGDSALGARPQQGMLAIVVVCKLDHEQNYRIPNDNCPLLPNGQPLDAIKDLRDPKVVLTMEKAQKARAIAKRKAEPKQRP